MQEQTLSVSIYRLHQRLIYSLALMSVVVKISSPDESWQTCMYQMYGGIFHCLEERIMLFWHSVLKTLLHPCVQLELI